MKTPVTFTVQQAELVVDQCEARLARAEQSHPLLYAAFEEAEKERHNALNHVRAEEARLTGLRRMADDAKKKLKDARRKACLARFDVGEARMSLANARERLEIAKEAAK